MLTIPKDARPAKCRHCGTTIYWVERPRAGGRPGMVRVPVDTDALGAQEPDSMQEGRGEEHWHDDER